MKKIPTLFLSTLIAFAAMPGIQEPLYSAEIPKDLMQKVKPATLKVLLLDNTNTLLLEVKGHHQIFDPISNIHITSSSFSNRGFVVSTENGIKWGELLPGISQARIVPGDSQTSILVNGIQYKGCIEIYEHAGTFTVVNEIDIENYLRSILAFQFTEEMPGEALNALAICARTNLYYLIERYPQAHWHVRADEMRYQGYGVTLQNIALEQAIAGTRHAILTYDSTPFATTWTANSAGKTADYSSIYRKNMETPAGVEVPLVLRSREKFAWSFSISRVELAKIAHLNKISNISLFSEKQSGKVYAVRFSERDEAANVSFFDLQKALGKSKLKSNDFSLDVKGEVVTFKGYGEGCGVGLCLYSAKVLAEEGLDAQKILSTFYPNTKIEKWKTLAHRDTSTDSGLHLR